MESELKDKFPDTTGDWEDVSFPTPEGRAATWKKLRSTGDQEFYCVEKSGKASFRKLPGILEIFYRQDAGCLALMSWRVPTAVEKSTDFSKLAALMAGSVMVKEKE
jgi:hypothetical protein